jgi:hydroxypyruvate isomerase
MNRRTFIASSTSAAALSAAALAHPSVQPSSSETVQSMKLKYGPHPGMFGSHGKTIEDQIAFFAEQGFKGFEDNGMKGRSKEEQEGIARALETHGVKMGIFVAHSIEWSNPTLTTDDKRQQEKFLVEIRESIEVAKRMNTKTMTIVPGVEARNIPHGKQTTTLIETLKRAAAICEPHGVVMVLEPLNWRDHPGLFVRYSDHAYEIMKGVGSPSCKILFDIYHQQATEGNVIENIHRYWDEIGYFQIGDNPGRREPGTGELNYRNIFKAIHSRGYEGVMGMEHGKSKDGKDGELALIKAYRDADAFE